MINRQCRTLFAIGLASALGVASAFAQTDAQKHVHLATGSSPFPAPEKTDTVFVVDEAAGLDTGCTFSSAGDLVFTIDIDRYVGDVDLLRANGLICETVLLRMPAFDVDFDADVSGFEPERDEVYVNGHRVNEVYLTGANEVWKLNAFQVELDWLDFPADPGAGTVVPAANEIRIKVDTANPGQDVWCTAIDWAALEIDVARPVVMVHGIFSDGGIWDGTWVTNLDGIGIPSSNELSMGALASIEANAAKIASEVESITTRWGVDKVHLVGHSKGGIDSRHFAESSDRVQSLVQLGTPNAGSPLADLVQSASIGVCFWKPPLCALILAVHLLAGPAGIELTTDYMQQSYNPHHGHNPNVHYVSLAGDYDPACTFPPSVDCVFYGSLLAITGKGDSIVPVSSVHALSYADHVTHLSAGGDKSATHGGLHGSQTVFDAVNGVVTGLGSSCSVMQASALIACDLAASEGDVLEGGQSAGFTFVADHPGASELVLVHPDGAEFRLRLTSPSGATYDSEIGSTAAAAHGDGVVFDGRVSTFSFAATETGYWAVDVEAVSTPAGPTPFIVGAFFLGAAITLDGSIADPNVGKLDPLALRAAVANAGAPIVDATVHALVAGPTGTVTRVELHDDGAGADETAGDGIYSAVHLDTSASGAYRIVFTAEADGSGSSPAFRREDFVIATVASSNSTIGRAFADHGEDTNGDGLFEELAIDAMLSISDAGTYRLFGILSTSTGHTFEASVVTTLPPGTHAVTLPFDGAAIYAQQTDGPYALSRITLIEEAELAVIPVDEVEDAHETAAYAYQQFQHAPLVPTGNGVETTIDTNGNGLFDVLQIGVELAVQTAADYQWSARLVTQGGAEIGFASGSGPLSNGTNLLALPFDGTSIGSAGVDGPYFVRDFLAFGGAASLVAGVVYETLPYDASLFEGFIGSAFVPGATLTGAFATMDQEAAIGFNAVKGLTLHLDFPSTDQVTRVNVRLVDPAGATEQSFVMQLSPSKKHHRSKTLLRSGLYHLVVDPIDGAPGGLKIKTGRSLPAKAKKVAKTLEVGASGAAISVLGLPGATIDVTLTPAGEPATPFDVILLAPSGTPISIASSTQVDADGTVRITDVPVIEAGLYRFELTNPSGSSVTVKAIAVVSSPKKGNGQIELEFE